MWNLSRLGIWLLILGVATSSYLNVGIDRPGHQISPDLWGIFFEEINHAGDGGLYGELIKNRNLAPKIGGNMEGYDIVQSEQFNQRLSLDHENPLNEVQTVSLRLDILSELTNNNQRIGIANYGYWGIPTRPDYNRYVAVFWVKAVGSNFRGPLTVSIESNDEKTVYARGQINEITDQFARYEIWLDANPDLIQVPRKDNKFTITASGPVPAGTSLIFNMVSLFPPTFNNRPNGLRSDLAQLLKDARPSFLRFPGGNFLEGNNINDRFIWEETIGDILYRPGHMGCWGYYSTDGLGILEYAILAEDIGASLVLGVFAGYALNHETTRPEDLGPYVESALNEIEYLIGDVNSTWGAVRAAHGHPEPFNLPYVEIGNEDFFSDDYNARYPVFYDAISARYPQLQIIATTPAPSRPNPIVDDHFYPGFGWFPDNHRHYDNYPRNGPKIFVGEYATRDNFHEKPEANAAAAMDDAAFMTGIERNSDIVVIASYAPLFGNLDDLVWTPDAIYYDAVISFGTPGWWVQHLFSVNRGDTFLPTESDANEGLEQEKIFHVASRRTDTNTLILKIVNTWFNDILIDNVQLQGVAGTRGGTITVLSGGQWDVNDLENPRRVYPQTSNFDNTGNSFSYNAPAFSLTIFELQL